MGNGYICNKVEPLFILVNCL